MSGIARALRWGAGQVGRAVLFLVGGLILLIVVGAVAGAPPEHAVSLYGGAAINVRVVSAYPGQHIQGPIAPTTSLANARCEAWQQARSGTCPDEATLAGAYWPDLQQQPHMLYVGLLSTCQTSPDHFNVELVSTTLFLHCHVTAPWVSTERSPMGVAAEILTDLVLVPTDKMEAGSLYVVREDRVERWLSDQVTSELIGVVTITNSV
jgi:hypothetical protein